MGFTPQWRASGRLAVRARLIVACLTPLVWVVAAAPGSAHAAALNIAQPLSAGYPVAGATGLAAPAASSQQVAAELKASTGFSPSQVASQPVCSAPGPGQASCDSRVVVTAAGEALVHPSIPAQPTFGQIVPATSGAHPFAVTTSTPASPPTPTTPGYLEQAYDLSYLSQTAGMGDTVGIVDAYDDPSAESDLARFRSQYGLPACTTVNGCFKKVNQNGQSSPLPAYDGGWSGEIALDLAAVSSLCPNCRIVLVEANSSYLSDLNISIAQAQAQGAEQISNSYSGGGSSPSGQGQASWPGVSVIASTGDHGVIGPGYDAYPASFPGFVAAGGTSVSAASTGLRGYGESAWSLSNGWGGGSGCNMTEAKPAWQTDTGCTGRSYADVSADADPNTGLSIYSSAYGGWVLFGGTSLSSPLIAGYEAVTGMGGQGGQWPYQNASLLNDPATGSTGSCATQIAYICNAQTGYDGPTGAGSISGAVATGAPGVGGPTYVGPSYTSSLTTSSAALSAGLYPNGLATTYYWQYGTTTAYGQRTATQSVAAGTAPVPATAALTGLSAQTTYHYRLVASNADGTYYGYDYSLATNGSSPVSAAAPVISGTTTQGQTLSTTTGAWNPPTGETFGYQWQRSPDGQSWTAIAGATTASYTLGAADVGDYVNIVVIASNAYGSGQATAGQVGTIASGAPHANGPPTISGAAANGNVLNANSSWSPAGASYGYQWKRSSDSGTTWSSISGATAQANTVTQADEHDLLEVIVTATNTYGSASATSATIGPIVSNPPVNTSAPTISGTSQRSYSLNASAGTWNGVGNAYAYQWQSSPDGSTWSNISGATAASHVLGVADEGLQERVLISASNVDGIATATSGASQVISPNPPGNQTPPAVSGTAMRTHTLSATPGTWLGPDNTYTFQWQENAGGGFHDVYGATGPTYALSTSDEGFTVRVVVTATNPDATISETSQPTTTVLAALPVNTSAPTVSGTAARMSSLSAIQGVWSGLGNSYTIQWQHSSDANTWTDIAGTTGASYTIGVADESTYLRVMVTATNPDGTAQLASAPSAVIAPAPPTNQSVPAIAGQATRGLTLTSTQGTWSGIGNTYAYQWQRSVDGQNWTAISGAVAPNYALSTADEGDQVRLTITATNADGTLTANSNTTGVVQSAAPANTATPTIAGAAVRGTTLTSTLGTWSGVGNTYAMQWQRSADGQNWTNIPSAVGANYTLTSADEGDQVRLAITATNADGTLTANSHATGVVQSTAPVNTSVPTLSGWLVRSAMLTSTQGTWSGQGNTYTQRWQRSADGQTWTNVSNGGTYVLGTADEGDHIRVAVTATNADGAVTAYSAASAPIAAAPPLNTAIPTVAGTPVRGQVLAATQGSWQGIANTYVYQWQSSPDSGVTWTNIHGAWGQTYTLAAADEGNELRIVVSAVNPDATATVASAPTAAVAASPPANTAAPVITGTPQRAQVLSVAPGSWTGTTNAYTYQWERDSGSGFVAITGASSAAYTVTGADENARLEATVTATNPDGSVQAASAPTSSVPSAPPVATANPTILGSATRGATLTGGAGTWSGIANSYTLQWQRSTDSGQTWANINGATATTYALSTVDEGAEVRFAVTATNVDATVTAVSPASATVAASPPVNTAAPSVSGSPQRDGILTSTPGTWSGLGNTLTTQWQRSNDGTHWLTINGATGATYTLAVADEGSELRVLVSATNPDTSVSAASVPTAFVTGAAPVVTASPTVSGTAQRASVLTAAQGSWSGIDNSYTEQWQRSTDGGSTWSDLTGAVAATYTLGLSDEATKLRLAVTATNADGTVTAFSLPTSPVSAAPPALTGAPAVTGAAVRGSMLAGSTGTWAGAGNTYAFQWQSSPDLGQSWANISGATQGTYPLSLADENTNIRVVVTATNPDGTLAAASPATAAVQGAPPVNTLTPSVTGLARLGGVLTAAAGNWSPAGVTLTLQWQAGSAGAGYQNITGATGTTFTVTSAQVGQSVRVLVTGANPDGSRSASSPATATVVAPPHNTTAPTAPFGTLQDSFTLTADPGVWDTSTTYSYQWVRCPASATAITATCTNLATGPTYVVAGADVGSLIGVEVTASSAGGSTTANSALTAVIVGQSLTNRTPPWIVGNPQVPNTLSANPGTWSVTLTSVSYTWQRCDTQGANCTTVATNQSSYPLSAADAGHTIMLGVAAVSPGRTASANSRPLLVSAQPVPQPTSLPTIGGMATRAATLTVYPGTWTNSPTTVTYQWESCNAQGQSCLPIHGATSITYVPVKADEGQTLTVVATATNASGTGTATAAVTSVVAGAPPSFTSSPTVASLTNASSVAEDGVLTTINGRSRGPSGTTVSIRWQRCDSAGANCQPIAGATGSAYQLVAADVGHTIVVADTATNMDGTASSASVATAVVGAAAPRWLTLPTLAQDPGHVGDVLATAPGTWSAPTPSSDTLQMMRCTNTCAAVATLTGTHPTYTIVAADAGGVLRVAETAVNASGRTSVWSSWFVGPVGSTVVAAGTLAGSAQVALRNDRGRALAFASIAGGVGAAGDLTPMLATSVSPPRGVGQGLPTLVLRIHAAHGITGRLVAWVCPVALGHGGAPLPCTAKISLTGSATIRLPSWMDAMANPNLNSRVPAQYRGRLRLVVKRVGR